MGKKSLIATIVGISGGAAFGFAFGYYTAVVQLIDDIPNLVSEIAGTYYARAGTLIGEGLAVELLKYSGERNSKVAIGYIVGVILISISIMLAYKTGETSWIPWRKKKEE